MADENDAIFKVTDRRKFNPDGTMRETADEIAAPAPAQEQSANVVAFPGEAARRAEATEQASGAAASAQTQAGPRPSSQQIEGAFLNLINMLAVEAAMHLGLIRREGQER